MIAGEHVPDRFGEPAGEVDLGDLGSASAAEPAFGLLVALGVVGVLARVQRRLGRQRGPKVAQIDLARRLTEAIWHMLTRNQPFAPAGAPFRLAA